MALCPFADHKLIRPGSSDPAIKVVGAILHVDAGNADSLFTFFRDRSGGIESHFHIKKDGVIEQYRDTGWEADANYKANSFIEGGVRKGYVSIETQGFGEGEWTDAQLVSIKRLLLWLSDLHEFPLRTCRNPTDPGVGFHTLFGAPSAWTPVSKSCPGPDRKVQFSAILVPWFAHPREGEQMTEQQEKMLADALAGVARLEKAVAALRQGSVARDKRVREKLTRISQKVAQGDKATAADLDDVLAALAEDDEPATV